MGKRHVTGFVFDLSLVDGTTRTGVQMQGSGGLVGAGMLGALNSAKPALTASKAERKALMRARQMLVRDGDLKVLRSWDLPPQERFEVVDVREVLACRVVLSGGAQ